MMCVEICADADLVSNAIHQPPRVTAMLNLTSQVLLLL
jgi:hypothetical protein